MKNSNCTGPLNLFINSSVLWESSLKGSVEEAQLSVAALLKWHIMWHAVETSKPACHQYIFQKLASCKSKYRGLLTVEHVVVCCLILLIKLLDVCKCCMIDKNVNLSFFSIFISFHKSN